MTDLNNEVANTAIILLDWTLAVKSVRPAEKVFTPTTTIMGEGVDIGDSHIGGSQTITCFMEAMSLLVQLHRALGPNIVSEEIKKLVEAFTGKIVDMHAKTVSETTESPLKLADFSCPICFDVVQEPHTILCGHSYCKQCLLKESIGHQCRLCSYRFNDVDINDTRPNVLLMSITDKVWPNQKKTISLRNEANELFKQENMNVALLSYNSALELSAYDHLSLCNRAHTLWVLGKCIEALEDAELAIKHCPFWFKSYFRKAAILDSLGRYEDALCTLTLCIYLVKITKVQDDDSTLVFVKNEMVKVLLKIFSSALTAAKLSQRRRVVEPISSYSPYPDQKKRRSVDQLCEPDYASSSSSSSGESGEESLGSDFREGDSRKCMPTLKELSSLHRSKGRTPTHPSRLGHEPVATRLHHIFTLAVSEVANFEKHMPTNNRFLDESTISISDFECSLCYRLIYQPVTTICGHTYCRSCLERCLDHAPTCPLCKTALDSCVAYRRHAPTHTLEQLISRVYPKEYADRINQHLEELADGSLCGKNKETEIPIFVCTMAFPTVPCMLHVFEPRYRLMIRRCMEAGSKRFGMCCYLQDGDHNYGDFGTMLEIRNIQYFPDGRSVVNTVGVRRFKVLKKCIKDGYNVATIEFLEDKPVEEVDRSRLRECHENVFKDANDWLQSIDAVIRQRIITHFGNMPSPEEDWMNVVGGPAWTWWLLAILPLDAKAQLAILSMNSLHKRLESIQKVLRYVKTRLT
ncbi:LON peptidase N-terminal domain and RING finger protein 3 [Folsomia candida]|uniref:LON peptidase N-terminal domain and RING finger protein 3 n=1 Tax=Folsomia candida TaxID=158441 RepID=UPI000B8FC7F6|nr:LON peptidase N-terminal domain and RING finger protein 3 [Folsomia candida]XP_021953810.1 LON peptidase N-terminal domain and RING finger protein 3 [Folsomia candida]